MRNSNSRESVHATPDSYKCLEDYFGKEYKYDENVTNPIFQSFNNRCRELNELCRSFLVDPGEVQMCYMKWTKIRYCDFDNAKEWIRNNSSKILQILNPEMHDDIMALKTEKTIPYHKWYERGEVV